MICDEANEHHKLNVNQAVASLDVGFNNQTLVAIGKHKHFGVREEVLKNLRAEELFLLCLDILLQ